MATTTSTLPPVRTANYLPQALAPTISEETISLWLKLGAMEKLEQAVLDGYGDLLIGRTARLPQVNKFLRQVPMFQNKIYEIHSAVSKGKLRELQHLVDRKKLAACRDHVGATPLHKAVIFGYKDIILYLLDRYDTTLHIRDHVKLCKLQYFQYGNLPEHYMKIQDETTLRELRDGYLNNDIRKIKPKKSNSTMNSKKGYFKSTVGRVQIKELINKGNLEALEDIILRGHGGLLLGETSPNPTINDFLTMVPFYLKRIHDVHRAAMRGRLQEITKLLDHKSFAIATDQLGATPLHKAVWYENYDVAEYIVNNFPLSLNITDMDGRTPLHYAAVLRDNKDMYNILLNGGASKSVQDIQGRTPLHYAAFLLDGGEIYQILVDAGADTKAIDANLLLEEFK
ncbi:inversin-like [Centruroides sculpturatus]|uniref:inversin-like n=1 Tax=Centruroides sculpturatus TaxID=218467 RepID=UPI000C6D94D8|nr:inversin-like [Centruroides sculpturatus]